LLGWEKLAVGFPSIKSVACSSLTNKLFAQWLKDNGYTGEDLNNV